MLAIATVITWLAMTFTGASALFGSRKTVDEIMWQRRGALDANDREIYGRLFGALLLGFMIFMAVELGQDGPSAAYKNLGR